MFTRGHVDFRRPLLEKTLSLPAHKSAAEQAEDEGLDGPSRYHLYREIMPTFADYKELNITMEALDAFGQELKLFWGGLNDPDSITELMQSVR